MKRAACPEACVSAGSKHTLCDTMRSDDRTGASAARVDERGMVGDAIPNMPNEPRKHIRIVKARVLA